jgi:hypothetical protein
VPDAPAPATAQPRVPPVEPRTIVEPPRLIAPLPGHAPLASIVSKQLPDQLESWLKEIETEPTVDLDWRQRWAPTNAVATPAPERRSGVKLKIPAVQNPYRHTQADRIRRRWTRRFIGTGVALILLLGAIVTGPAAVAASLDIWSQIDEQFTPPPMPVLPQAPPRPAGAPAQITPPDDPFGAAAATSITSPGH